MPAIHFACRDSIWISKPASARTTSGTTIPRQEHNIEADPIGLVGGLNRYAYALANPVTFKDPSGLLSVKQLPIEGPLDLFKGVEWVANHMCDILDCVGHALEGVGLGAAKATETVVSWELVNPGSPGSTGVPPSPVFVSSKSDLREGLCETAGGAVGGGVALFAYARFSAGRLGRWTGRPSWGGVGDLFRTAPRYYRWKSRVERKALKERLRQRLPWPFGPRNIETIPPRGRPLPFPGFE